MAINFCFLTLILYKIGDLKLSNTNHPSFPSTALLSRHLLQCTQNRIADNVSRRITLSASAKKTTSAFLGLQYMLSSTGRDG